MLQDKMIHTLYTPDLQLDKLNEIMKQDNTTICKIEFETYTDVK